MKSLSFYLDQMNELIDLLIETAKELRDLTMHVFSETKVLAFQSRQKELLTQIESINQILETQYRNQIEEADHRRLKEKIDAFQMLNKEYIQNLKNNHGLIQFELIHSHVPNDEIEVSTHKLNKMPLSPNSSKAIKTKKAKKS